MINKLRSLYIYKGLRNHLCQEKSITNTDIAIKINVNQPITFEIILFVLFPRIFLSFAILIIIKRIGTDTTPLIIAVYINALIGFIPLKLILIPVIAHNAIIK